MRALVLSGGASKGAFQVGALRYLINDLNIQYDALCGVSVGALNCAFLSQFPKAQEKEAFIQLQDLWNNIDNSKVRKNWLPFGMLHGLWLDSVYNSKPLIDLVRSGLDLNTIRQSNRNIAVGAVSVSTGNYRSFTQKDDCFVDAVLASSSYPMGLNPIIIDGQKWTDGGVKHILPIQEAIDFGATDIDIILCGPQQTTDAFNDVDVITFGMRCFDLMTDQNIVADLKIAQLYNQLVSANLAPGKKYLNMKIIQPTQTLQTSSLNFDHAAIQQMLDQGYNEAKQQYQP